MNEKNKKQIIIPLDEYRSLIAKAESIEALKRFMAVNKYLNTEDVKAILAIDETKEGENA